MNESITKIVSGGQTGVDRAALDVARALGIEHGGWCPSGRRSEDGPIPKHYALRETESADYAVRTEQNVIDSDGTLILFTGEISGGTKLTLRMAEKHRRPHLCIDLACEVQTQAIQQFRSWLDRQNIRVLNVAGPRASSAPGIARRAENFLVQSLAPMNVTEP